MPTTLTALALATLLVPAGPPGGDEATGGLGFPGLGGPANPVTVSVKAPSSVAPGGDLVVAVVFDLSPGWHMWPRTGSGLPEGVEAYEDAIPTSVEAGAPPGSGLTPYPAFAVWPEVHGAVTRFGPEEEHTYAVYEGHAIVGIPVTVADDAAPGDATLTVTYSYQACNDRTCLMPVMGEVATVTVRIDAAAAPPTDPDLAVVGPDVFSGIRAGAEPPPPPAPKKVGFNVFGIAFEVDPRGAGLVVLLLLGALGGFLLNLTPCVLPVIPLKIMGLSQSAAGHRGRTLALGLSMTAGVIGFWLLLGGLIAGVAGFTATNQLFQYPAFTIGVGLFIAVMAVGMCGLFSIQLPKAVYLVNPSHETMHGSFVFGIMAAVLSTPCTAPFMGVVAAASTTLGATMTLVAFAAIGAGMSAPYLVLAAFPGLIRKMPRSGPASELIKQVMGLLMLAAAAYFVGVGVSGLLVSPPSPPSRAYFWFVALFGVLAGFWLLWRTLRITRLPARRLVFGGLGAIIVAISLAVGFRMTDQGPIKWVYYTPDRFAAAQAEGNVVVMEFTAEWCLNCKALEEAVLRRPEVVAALEAEGVIPMKVDLTGNNREGKEMLGTAGRLTIPLLVVYDTAGQEVFKSDSYTPAQVTEAIERARAPRVAVD